MKVVNVTAEGTGSGDPKVIHRKYEAAFQHDELDTAGAKQAKRLADEKLEAVLPAGSVVQSFECRASLCRLQTSHRSVDSYFEFARGAFLAPSFVLWNAPTYSTPMTDNVNDAIMVSYIARENHALPQID